MIFTCTKCRVSSTGRELADHLNEQYAVSPYQELIDAVALVDRDGRVVVSTNGQGHFPVGNCPRCMAVLVREP